MLYWAVTSMSKHCFPLQGLVVFVVIGLLVLAYCVEETQKGTYEDVMFGVLGPYAKAIAEFCVAIYCFGTTITFLVVIGDQIDDSKLILMEHRTVCK